MIMESQVESALVIIDQAVEEQGVTKVFAMFSGGHDSLSVTAIAARHPLFQAAVHINTGIGIEQTRQFVRDTCATIGWPLLELHPPDKTFRDFVLKYGFPGPYAHRFAYVWLKERAIRKLIREQKTHSRDRIALVTGVRLSESDRRMGYVKAIVRQGAIIWVAPILSWDGLDVRRFIKEEGLAENEVVNLLHMSGECLCGSFARKGELDWINVWYPGVVKEIQVLEAEVRVRGKPARWGHAPGDQRATLPLPMCTKCVLAPEEHGML